MVWPLVAMAAVTVGTAVAKGVQASQARKRQEEADAKASAAYARNYESAYERGAQAARDAAMSQQMSMARGSGTASSQASAMQAANQRAGAIGAQAQLAGARMAEGYAGGVTGRHGAQTQSNVAYDTMRNQATNEMIGGLGAAAQAGISAYGGSQGGGQGEAPLGAPSYQAQQLQPSSTVSPDITPGMSPGDMRDEEFEVESDARSKMRVQELESELAGYRKKELSEELVSAAARIEQAKAGTVDPQTGVRSVDVDEIRDAERQFAGAKLRMEELRRQGPRVDIEFGQAQMEPSWQIQMGDAQMEPSWRVDIGDAQMERAPAPSSMQVAMQEEGARAWRSDAPGHKFGLAREPRFGQQEISQWHGLDGDGGGGAPALSQADRQAAEHRAHGTGVPMATVQRAPWSRPVVSMDELDRISAVPMPDFDSPKPTPTHPEWLMSDEVAKKPSYGGYPSDERGKSPVPITGSTNRQNIGAPGEVDLSGISPETRARFAALNPDYQIGEDGIARRSGLPEHGPGGIGRGPQATPPPVVVGRGSGEYAPWVRDPIAARELDTGAAPTRNMHDPSPQPGAYSNRVSAPGWKRGEGWTSSFSVPESYRNMIRSGQVSPLVKVPIIDMRDKSRRLVSAAAPSSGGVSSADEDARLERFAADRAAAEYDAGYSEALRDVPAGEATNLEEAEALRRDLLSTKARGSDGAPKKESLAPAKQGADIGAIQVAPASGLPSPRGMSAKEAKERFRHKAMSDVLNEGAFGGQIRAQDVDEVFSSLSWDDKQAVIQREAELAREVTYAHLQKGADEASRRMHEAYPGMKHDSYIYARDPYLKQLHDDELERRKKEKRDEGGAPRPAPRAAPATSVHDTAPVSQYGYAMSDEHSKSGTLSSAATQVFENTPGYEYEYRPEALGKPGTAPGPRLGIMAQDLEKTPAGRTVVRQGPDGMKRVDTKGLTMINSAALHDVMKRLDQLEAGRG